MQLGVLGNVAKTMNGAQLGVVNVAKEVHGVQIGVFNTTRTLRGLQIGLANHAEDGLLAWSAILNMGFGDGENEGNGAHTAMTPPSPTPPSNPVKHVAGSDVE